MRVVHLNTSDFGGAAMAAIQLHEALLEQGVESDLLTLNRTRQDVPRHHRVEPFALSAVPAWAKARYKARRAMEVLKLVEDRHNAPDNRHLQDRPPGHEIFTNPHSFFDITDHPLMRQADIVHLHWVSYGMIDHERFFQKVGKPIIWTLHDMNPFTGGCHYSDGCTHFREQCEACPQLNEPRWAHVYWERKRRGYLQVPKDKLQVVTPSAWLGEWAGQSALLGDRPRHVVPNGFDPGVFRHRPEARRQLGLPEDRKILLFTALEMDNVRKGMPDLLQALELLRDPEIMLLSMGGGKLERTDIDHHHAGYITDPEKLALHYAAADLFVLPSKADNLPNTISESLMCGTPVVAFRVGGIPEQVNEGNGILVDEMSGEALAAAIRTAMDRSWDPAVIAGAAREHYDRNAVAAQYRQLYEGML